MLKVGLTGGIAVGKSHVSQFLTELGCYVFDADKVARDVVLPGKIGYEKVLSEFGSEIVDSDGTINRARLGQIIFNDPEKRQRLNEILHPIIIDEQNSLIEKIAEQDRDAIIVIDAALMIESGSYKRFDKLIVVYCDRELQIERLMKRNNYSREDAEARIASQMPTEEKRKYADYEINTSSTLDETKEQVIKLHKKLRELSQNR
jgi:dephospho-CoA kinase